MIRVFLFSLIFTLLGSGTFSAWAATPLPATTAEQARGLMEGELSIDQIKGHRLWEYLLGGDIIGNGGGLSEIRLHQIYQRLPRLLNSCLRSNQCPLTDREREWLATIVNVAKANRDLPYKLIFVSGQEFPHFFATKPDGAPRTARTGFKPLLPVFVNRDHLYDQGRPSQQTGELMALLIHELGHQAGFRGHTELDHLGSYVADYVMNGNLVANRSVAGKQLEWQVMNYNQGTQWPEMWWAWGEQSYSLTSGLRRHSKCSNSDLYPIGAEVTNLHWVRDPGTHKGESARMGAWLKLYCEDSSTMIWEEHYDLQIYIPSLSEGEQNSSAIKYLIQ